MSTFAHSQENWRMLLREIAGCFGLLAGGWSYTRSPDEPGRVSLSNAGWRGSTGSKITCPIGGASLRIMYARQIRRDALGTAGVLGIPFHFHWPREETRSQTDKRLPGQFLLALTARGRCTAICWYLGKLPLKPKFEFREQTHFSGACSSIPFSHCTDSMATLELHGG